MELRDIEDFGAAGKPKGTETMLRALATTTKRKRDEFGASSDQRRPDLDLDKSWQEALGPPPLIGSSKVRRS